MGPSSNICILFAAVLLLAAAQPAHGCLEPPGWTPLPIQQLIPQSAIVAYGTIKTYGVPESTVLFTCVVKSPSPAYTTELLSSTPIKVLNIKGDGQNCIGVAAPGQTKMVFLKRVTRRTYAGDPHDLYGEFRDVPTPAQGWPFLAGLSGVHLCGRGCPKAQSAALASIEAAGVGEVDATAAIVPTTEGTEFGNTTAAMP